MFTLVVPGVILGLYYYATIRNVVLTHERAFNLEVFAPAIFICVSMLAIALGYIIASSLLLRKNSKILEVTAATR